VTIVFAAYAVGVLGALLAFGRASDTIGRRPTLLAGLLAACLSTVVFLVAAPVHAHAAGLTLLLAGRLLSGLSAGIFTGTATAALADFAGDDRQTRASLVAAVANIGGLGLGPLVAGALAKHVAGPLVTPYAVHLVLAVAAIVLVAAVPEPVRITGPRRLSVQRLGVPAELRGIFVQSGTAGFAGFATFGFFTAVSAATLALLGHHDPLLTGVVVFVVFAASAIGQVASLALAVRTALISGTSVLVLGVGLVGAGIGLRSLLLLVLGGVVSGFGQGVSFRSALGSVTGASPPEQRAMVSSSFFAVCYVGISVPVVGVGAGTEAFGLVHTAEAFAGLVAVLGLVAVISLARSSAAPART
jgi:predicted MFS family arabinose efflux permease